MQRVRKFFLLLAGTVVGLLVLFVIFLKIFLTDERLRASIEPALEAQLGREVSVGRFETQLLRAFPNISIGAGDLVIHTPDNSTGERPDLAHAEWLWIDLSLFPLLQGRVYVNAVEIDHPQILVEVYDDLSTNLIELGGSGETAKSGEEASAVKEIAIERFIITEGQIAYSHADGTLLTIGSLNASLSAHIAELVTIAGIMGAGELYYETGGIRYADDWDVQLDIGAQANLDSSWVRIEETSLNIESLQLQLQGLVSNWDTDRIGVDLDIAAPHATIEGIWSLLPPALIKDVEGLVGTGAVDVAASIKGELAETEWPETDVLIVVQEGSLQYPGLPAAFQNINLDASFTLDALNIKMLTASAAGASIRLNGGVSNFTSPALVANLQLDADLAQIQAYYPLEDATTLSGKLSVDTQLEGGLASANTLTASGKAVLENINYTSSVLEQPIEGIAGMLVLSQSQIRVEGVSFNSGQSDFLLNGTLDNYMALVADAVVEGQEPFFQGSMSSEYLDVTEQLSEDTSSVGPIELPALLADVTFTAKKLAYDGLVLEQADGKITLDSGVIGFEGGGAGFLDGLLRASGTFDLSNPLQPVFEGTVGLDQVRASQFFTAFDHLDQVARLGTFLDGFFDSEASIALQMDQELNPILASLLAEGTFGATGGVLKGMPVQEELAGLTGLSSLSALSIGQWTHKFNISGEKLHIQALDFKAGDYAFSLNGTQGFDGTLDYMLRVDLPESAADALANAPVQASLKPLSQLANVALVDPVTQRITLDFLAAGTFLKPQLKLNSDMLKSRLSARASALADGARAEAQARLDSLENAARLKAEAELAKQKKLLEDKAKEEANKLLDGIVDSSGVATNLDSLKEKGGEVLKDRLKGLLKRKKKKN